MAEPKAENNVQHFLAKIAGAEETAPVPQTNVEHYLAKIAGEDVPIPEEPSTTEEYYLDKIAEGGVGVEVVPLTVDSAGTFEAPDGEAYSPVTVPSGIVTLGALTKEQVDNNTVRVVGTVTKGKGFIQDGTESKNTTVQASEVTSGTLNIVENGTFDVTNFKSAVVNVAGFVWQANIEPQSTTTYKFIVPNIHSLEGKNIDIIGTAEPTSLYAWFIFASTTKFYNAMSNLLLKANAVYRTTYNIQFVDTLPGYIPSGSGVLIVRSTDEVYLSSSTVFNLSTDDVKFTTMNFRVIAYDN